VKIPLSVDGDAVVVTPKLAVPDWVKVVAVGLNDSPETVGAPTVTGPVNPDVNATLIPKLAGTPGARVTGTPVAVAVNGATSVTTMVAVAAPPVGVIALTTTRAGPVVELDDVTVTAAVPFPLRLPIVALTPGVGLDAVSVIGPLIPTGVEESVTVVVAEFPANICSGVAARLNRTTVMLMEPFATMDPLVIV